jgi:hypothetical protein
MSTNGVWDLEEVSNGAKTVGLMGLQDKVWLQREYRNI